LLYLRLNFNDLYFRTKHNSTFFVFPANGNCGWLVNSGGAQKKMEKETINQGLLLLFIIIINNKLIQHPTFRPEFVLPE